MGYLNFPPSVFYPLDRTRFTSVHHPTKSILLLKDSDHAGGEDSSK